MRLRVATLNVWGLPFGLARDLPARLEAIGSGLRGLDVDVMAFQEVWTRRARASLEASARASGLVHHWPRDGQGVRGGLLVASRLPFSNGRFERFHVRGLPERVWHSDYYAGKGFAELHLQTGSDSVSFLATHLHSQYGPDAEDIYRGHRMAQVVQLAAHLRSLSLPVVAVGDFNLREDQPHHRVLTALSGVRDAAIELDRREATIRADNPYRRGSRPRKTSRIDYVFARDGVRQTATLRSLERIFDEPIALSGREAAHSDHSGLRAEIELEPRGSDRPVTPPDAGAAAEAISVAREILLAGRADSAQRRLERRAVAVGGGLLATVGLLGARSSGMSRRHVLRGLMKWAGALAGSAGLGALAAAELASPDETRAFDSVLRELDRLESGA